MNSNRLRQVSMAFLVVSFLLMVSKLARLTDELLVLHLALGCLSASVLLNGFHLQRANRLAGRRIIYIGVIMFALTLVMVIDNHGVQWPAVVEALQALVTLCGAGGMIYVAKLHFSTVKKGGRWLDGLLPTNANLAFACVFVLVIGMTWTFFEPVMSGKSVTPSISFPILMLTMCSLTYLFTIFTALTEKGVVIGTKLYPYDAASFTWSVREGNPNVVYLKLTAGTRRLTCKVTAEQAAKIKHIVDSRTGTP